MIYRVFCLSAILMAFIFPAAVKTTAFAETVSKNTYLKKVSENETFRVVLLGDSLANGLYQGLSRLNKDRDWLKTKRKSKVNTGLVRVDRLDWNKTAKKIARSGKYQAAVVLLGLNDLQSIREKGKAHHFNTEGWTKRYVARVEMMMTDLKASGMSVYWVGIPIVSPKRYQKEYLLLNEIYRKAAIKIGVRFVDTWTPLVGRNGKYTPYYVGVNGKKKSIRLRDGVHFTPEGYQILANIFNDVLLGDLTVISSKPPAEQPIKETRFIH